MTTILTTDQATHKAPSPVAPATGKRPRASKKAQAGLLFLTVNTCKRLRVFTEPALCEIFFKELEFYRGKFGFELYGYVLLPDHFHLLLHFPAGRDFAAFLRDFKSSVGRLVIDWARGNGRIGFLRRMQLRQRVKRRRDSRYAVLQSNSYVRRVTSSTMFKQKLDYIHNNPVRAKLVTAAIEYPYSSLRNYELRGGPVRIDWHGIMLR